MKKIVELKRLRNEYELFCDYEMRILELYNETMDKQNFDEALAIIDFVLFSKSDNYFSGRAKAELLSKGINICADMLIQKYFIKENEIDSFLNKIKDDTSDYKTRLFKYVDSAADIISRTPSSLHISKSEIMHMIEQIHEDYELLDYDATYLTLMIEINVKIRMLDEVGLKEKFEQYLSLIKKPTKEDIDLQVRYYLFVQNFDKVLALEQAVYGYELYHLYPFYIQNLHFSEPALAYNLFKSGLKLVEQNNDIIVIPAYMLCASLLRYEKQVKELNDLYRVEIINNCDLIYCLQYFIATIPLLPHHYVIAIKMGKDFDERNENHYYENFLNGIIKKED